MSLKLLRLSFLITMCTSTPLPSSLPPASHLLSTSSDIFNHWRPQRTTVSSAVMMATHRRRARRHYAPGLSVARATYRKGVLYDPRETEGYKDKVYTERSDITSSNVEPKSMIPRDVTSGSSTPVMATAVLLERLAVSSNAFPGPISPGSDGSQPGTISHTNLHPAVIPAFVGSAMGAAVLTALTILVICRRRIRARQNSDFGTAASHSWFNSNKKDGVIFIRVPPPTVPLKSILIRNTSFPSTPDDACSDRVSLTSSQMSVMINKLPKSYDSGLGDGVLDEVREPDRNSPNKDAQRIGPSPSDFLGNLFGLGHADSFGSGTSSMSAGSTLPPSASSHSLPKSPRRSSKPTKASCSAYELPPLKLLNSPKPTWPPPVASPILGHFSGPRGHGLVLTGDKSAPTPSFAQWHHQRNLARSRMEI